MVTDAKLNFDRKRKAVALLEKNRLEEAAQVLENVVRSNKNDLEAWISLAQVNGRLGRPGKVEKSCREILRIKPASHDAYFHLGSSLMFQQRREEAAEAFRAAARLNPRHVASLFNLGVLSTSLDEAFECFEAAASLNPAYVEAHCGVAAALVSFGQVEEAISRLELALQLRPSDHGVRSSLLFTLNYSDLAERGSVFKEHVRWGKGHVLNKTFQHDNAPRAERRLRVGYVSPDFYTHSVAYFFEPLLAHHNADAIETFCYSDVARPDDTTERLQTLAHHWKSVRGMSDADLAEHIHADRIDILVDLAGHTNNNRLLVFSAKPAPIQVTYLGYPNTTGLTSMDYRFTDEWADPDDGPDSFHTEALVRLSGGFLSYRPPLEAPGVVPAPCTRDGRVTFGSFNHLPKVTPAVAKLWAEVLRATPGSRLLLKNASLTSCRARERYSQLFAENGISAERLVFLERTATTEEHLASYGKIDIALDTFPYNGTTTTCEALYMGVPVVTLAGTSHAARVGVSLLNRIGASELIASSPREYVQKASQLAQNRPELVSMRSGLRARLEKSSLCDGPGFTRGVEEAYRQMWLKWCDGARP